MEVGLRPLVSHKPVAAHNFLRTDEIGFFNTAEIFKSTTQRIHLPPTHLLYGSGECFQKACLSLALRSEELRGNCTQTNKHTHTIDSAHTHVGCAGYELHGVDRTTYFCGH